MLYTLILILYYTLITFTCVRIIIDTPNQSKALGYLFLVLFFPIIGIIIYFSIGVNYRKNSLYQKKIIIDEKRFSGLRDFIEELREKNLEKVKSELGYFLPLAKNISGESLSTQNNAVQLLINGENKFPILFEDLKRAKHFIHIEYYIYENDTMGNKLAKILIEKAKQGVKVRFIYDDFGSSTIRGKFVKHLKENGVEVAPFYKIKLHVLINRINYRNHRKIVVIDGITGYVGGINTSDRYCNPNNFNLYWRDTHLKITGDAVLNLQRIFIADWNFCTQDNLEYSPELFPFDETVNYGYTFTQITSSGPDSQYPSILYSLIQAITLSKKEILITTPYFVPEKSFIDAVLIARLSGVEVHILVPGISDSFIVNTVSNSYYQELLEAGVHIYKYMKGFVHAKTMVCDDFISVVGTANLDQRSFDLNFEVNAIVYDKAIAKQLKEAFYNDIENAEKLDLEKWNKRSAFTKLIERILHLFSPLM